MELAIFPSMDTQISISVETQGKLRRLLDEKDLSHGIMQAEKMIIPEDIPPGQSYWLIESSHPQGLVRIPFVVQEKKLNGQVQVLDPFGNQLFGVDISDAESGTKIASTNEWGYVALDTPASTLKFNHQGYVPLVLETTDKNPIQVVRLSYAQDDSEKI